MKWLYHTVLYHYYTVRIFLFVQWLRVYYWWNGGPSLWQYNWRQIVCGMVAHSLRQKREQGLEPSYEELQKVRDIERQYRIKPSSF